MTLDLIINFEIFINETKFLKISRLLAKALKTKFLKISRLLAKALKTKFLKISRLLAKALKTKFLLLCPILKTLCAVDALPSQGRWGCRATRSPLLDPCLQGI